MADDLQHELLVLPKQLDLENVDELRQPFAVILAVSDQEVQNPQNVGIQVVQLLSCNLEADMVVAGETVLESEVCPQPVWLKRLLTKLLRHRFVVNKLQRVSKQFGEKVLLQLLLHAFELDLAFCLSCSENLMHVAQVGPKECYFAGQLALVLDRDFVAEAEVIDGLNACRRLSNTPVDQVVVKILYC